MISFSGRLRQFYLLSGYASEAIISALFGLMIMMIATRSATISEFSQFAFVIAIVGIQLPISAYGLNTIAYGRASSRPFATRRILGTSVLVVSLFSFILYILTLTALWFLENKSLFYLYAAAGLRIFGGVGILLKNDAMARSAQSEYLLVRILLLLIFIVIALFSYKSNSSLLIIGLVWGAEAFCFSIAMVLFQYKSRYSINLKGRVHKLLLKSSPIAIQSVFVMIYMRFDQLYIAYRFNDEALSWYATAARVAEVGNLSFNVLTLVISPIIIGEIVSGRRLVKTKILMICLFVFTIAACSASFFLGGSVLGLVFGSDYAPASGILTIYLASICFVAYGSIGSRVLASMSISGPQAWSGFVGALSNVILSVALGELVGLNGIAFATVFSYALAAAVMWRAVWKVKSSSAIHR